MENQLDKINKVIAVMAYARAASGLWSSLLDGHPNILTTPDCFIMDFHLFWDNNHNLPLENLVKSFIDRYEPIFDSNVQCKCHKPGNRSCGDYLGWTKMGKDKNQFLFVDKHKFCDEMLNLLKDRQPVSRRDFFVALHYAYTLQTRKEIKEPMVISFGLHISNSDRVEKLISDFPETYFLQTIRNPLNGFNSWVNHYHNTFGLALNNVFGLFYLIFSGGKPLTKNNKNNWKAVRFEDIHTKPKETIDKVRKWIGIPQSDWLYKSTWNRLQWWNEKNSKKISGCDKDMLKNNNYHKFFFKIDKFRLMILLLPKFKKWKYSFPNYIDNIFIKFLVLPLLLLPFKIEIFSLRHPEIKGNIIKKSILYLPKVFAAYLICRYILITQWFNTLLNKNDEVTLL